MQNFIHNGVCYIKQSSLDRLIAQHEAGAEASVPELFKKYWKKLLNSRPTPEEMSVGLHEAAGILMDLAGIKRFEEKDEIVTFLNSDQGVRNWWDNAKRGLKFFDKKSVAKTLLSSARMGVYSVQVPPDLIASFYQVAFPFRILFNDKEVVAILRASTIFAEKNFANPDKALMEGIIKTRETDRAVRDFSISDAYYCLCASRVLPQYGVQRNLVFEEALLSRQRQLKSESLEEQPFAPGTASPASAQQRPGF